jgi:PIN domain nuclease of toxin-antitoxin system
VRLLLDSHAFVWWAENNPALSSTARIAIADPENEVLVSVAGAWELVIKARLGKLPLPDDVETMMIRQGFSLLAISFIHLRRYATLQLHHKDPFDRMMIAQALAEGIPIATADRRFSAYGVQVMW